jgi:uncharacterized protein (DUF952 family)
MVSSACGVSQEHGVALIYKICHRDEWEAALRQQIYAGSAMDREDRFIHFSTAAQVPGTLEKYYAGADGLVLVAVDTAPLGAALRFEPSREGALFPHLYGTLPLTFVKWAKPVQCRDGAFVLPPECV